MKYFREQLLKSSLWVLLFSVFTDAYAQQDVELVPIVTPEERVYNWYIQNLPFWGTKIQFPEEPEYKVKEIYTDKGLVPQKVYSWSDYREELILEASFYKLPESIHTKNEKKLIEAVISRIAVIHGGYPVVSNGLVNQYGVREYLLEIKTLKGGVLKGKVFAESDQVLIVSALVTKSDNDLNAQARYFLDKITFNPLPGELLSDQVTAGKSIAVKPASSWDTLAVENVLLAFPRYPIAQHKVLERNGVHQKYYEWYMGDGATETTYLVSLLPLSDFYEKDIEKIIVQAVETSLKTTGGELIQQRNLDYFKHPLEEVVFKTDDQYFRVRYFSDGKYLYQLLVSGKKESIYQPDANRFLDGLKWK